MREITQNEFDKLSLKSSTRKGANPIISSIKKMSVGQIFFVEKSEWKLKTPLGISVYSSGIRTGARYSVLAIKDETGWIVKRVS